MYLPLVLAATPVLVALVVILLREPLRVALPLFAATVPFGQFLSFGSSAFVSLSSILGLLLAVGLVLDRIRAGKVSVRLSPTVPIWLLFLGVAGATTLWSVAPGRTQTGFLILGSLVGIFALVSLNDVDAKALRRTENGLLLGGVLATSYGCYQFFIQGGFPGDPPGLGVQPDGRFGNGLLGPNNEAVALLLPLLIALSRAVVRSDFGKRLLHTSIVVVLLLGIVFTGSRGGLLATAVAISVLIIATPQGRRLLLAYGAVGLVGAAFVFFANPGGIAERTVETTASSGRTDIWRVALAACPQYCPTGSGWETFPDVYAATQPEVPGARVLVGAGTYEPHDVWILVAIELGVPGLLLFGAAVVRTLHEAGQLPGRLRGPPLAGFVATLFAAFFLSNLEYKFFWMSLIYVAMARNLAELEARQPGHLVSAPAGGLASGRSAAGDRG